MLIIKTEKSFSPDVIEFLSVKLVVWTSEIPKHFY